MIINMITEDYVSFEISKLLKEKGFKQDCDYATSWYAAEYYKNSALGEWFEGEHQIIEDIDDKCAISYLSNEGVFIPAPTLQMAMKWLREEKNRLIEINYDKPKNFGKGYVCRYSIYDTDLYCIHEEDNFKSVEDAIEAAIKYALENLI